jgi:alkylated DNA repair dioxygenase AlkB
VSATPDWQPSLFDEATELVVDETFASLARVDLDPESWVDYAPAWVTGADELFAELLASTTWGQRTRTMFDKRVVEPRLPFELGRGDLLVTGGRTQRLWQHSVPKVAAAGPRISLAFRHGMAAKVYG